MTWSITNAGTVVRGAHSAIDEMPLQLLDDADLDEDEADMVLEIPLPPAVAALPAAALLPGSAARLH